MDGYIMDAMWGLVGSMIGVLSTLLVSYRADKKAYRKIEGMLGKLDNTTLSDQYNDIKKSISDKQNEIIRYVEYRGTNLEQKSRELSHIVESIKSVVDKIEVRYENLSFDQRDMRNNVLKMVHNYETLTEENRRLREENAKLYEAVSMLKNHVEKYNTMEPVQEELER